MIASFFYSFFCTFCFQNVSQNRSKTMKKTRPKRFARKVRDVIRFGRGQTLENRCFVYTKHSFSKNNMFWKCIRTCLHFLLNPFQKPSKRLSKTRSEKRPVKMHPPTSISEPKSINLRIKNSGLCDFVWDFFQIFVHHRSEHTKRYVLEGFWTRISSILNDFAWFLTPHGPDGAPASAGCQHLAAQGGGASLS